MAFPVFCFEIVCLRSVVRMRYYVDRELFLDTAVVTNAFRSALFVSRPLAVINAFRSALSVSRPLGLLYIAV